MKNNLTNSGEQYYKIVEIAEMLQVPRNTIEHAVRVTMPNKMQNGKTTYLNEAEVTVISKYLKKHHNNNLSSTSEVPRTKQEEDELIKQSLSILIERDVENKRIIKKLTPKADAFDRLMDANNTISMGDFAKTIGWGRNTFLKELRKNKVIDKNNIPYQTYMQYFEIIQVEKNGTAYPTARIAPEGMAYLSKVYQKQLTLQAGELYE